MSNNDKEIIRFCSATVIGAGSWGTAIAIHLARKGTPVVLWGHRSEHIELLKQKRVNDKYLAEQRFPDSLHVTANLQNAVEEAQCICMAVPSHVYREIFSKIIALENKPKNDEIVFISATKGIEQNSLSTMTQVMNEEIINIEKNYNTAVLSGPSFAKEVALKVPTAVTIGSKNEGIAKGLQQLFNTDFFRVYTSTDVIGLEIAAALKNIIAIAAGISDGLGFGSNARAALITRGLAEITRFGKLMGAEEKTFYGLSGLGDLVLTCTGALSRNRYVGLEIGKGRKIGDIINGMSMVAEGVKTTLSVRDLAKRYNIEMPILEQVYQIIYKNKNTETAVRDLLTRDLKDE